MLQKAISPLLSCLSISHLQICFQPADTCRTYDQLLLAGWLLLQDISGVFGMASTDDDQQELFDMEDEEAAALWDLDDLEVERLRAAPSQQMSDGGGLSGLVDPSVTPGVAGPAGKGAKTAQRP